jgi:hypothetical protein
MHPPREPVAPLPDYSPLAGLLSYVVPGLGQIYQGRIGKGILFLVCLYGMFFTGMALGHWKNVYLPDTAAKNGQAWLPVPVANLWSRLHFAGQFWIGAAAWPALWQYAHYDPNQDADSVFGTFERAPKNDDDLNKLQQNSDKTWDLGWVYTVIAGVLNILVIYDAFAGAAFAEAERTESAREEAAPA